MSRDALRRQFPGGVTEAIKNAALAQLAVGGVESLSLNRIAQGLGVSGPALYKYFDSRRALLDALIADAYADLARAVDTGTTTTSNANGEHSGDGPVLFARAYRRWALREPHRYRLLFRAPVAGFDANAAPLVAAAQMVMHVLLTAVRAAEWRTPEPPARLGAQMAAWATERGEVSEPAQTLAAVRWWSRLHGLVSLEIEGAFTSMRLDPTVLYEMEITGAETIG